MVVGFRVVGVFGAGVGVVAAAGRGWSCWDGNLGADCAGDGPCVDGKGAGVENYGVARGDGGCVLESGVGGC